MRLRYTPGIDAAGDVVVATANAMRSHGDAMFTKLRSHIGNKDFDGQMAIALDEAQQRWTLRCDELANSENRFGIATKDCFADMMATDARRAAAIGK